MLERREVMDGGIAQIVASEEFGINTSVEAPNSKDGNQSVGTVGTGNANESRSVAMNDAGEFVVVWLEPTSSSDDPTATNDIFAQRFNRFGDKVGDEINVGFMRSGTDGTVPQVALANNGSFTVLWGGATGADGGDIFARQFDATGTALGAEFTVNVEAAGKQFDASIAMDNAGNFVVVWTDAAGSGEDTNGGGPQGSAVKGRLFSIDPGTGLIVGGNEFLVNTYTFGAQSKARVAMNSTGEFVVAFTSVGSLSYNFGQTGVLVQRYRADGVKLGTDMAVDAPGVAGPNSEQLNPSIAIDDNGSFVVVWGQSPINPNPYENYFARRYDVAEAAVGNNPWGAIVTLGARRDGIRGTGAMSIAMDASGDFAIVSDLQTTNALGQGVLPAIIVQQYDKAGNAKGTAQVANADTRWGVSMPAIAMSGDGDFIVTWVSAQKDGAFPPPNNMFGDAGIYGRLFHIVPAVNGVSIPNAPSYINAGERLAVKPTALAIEFNREMDLASVTNTANYSLTLNGQTVSLAGAVITYTYNSNAGKSTAVITFPSALAAGDYVFTVIGGTLIDSVGVLSVQGEKVDGNGDGTPGGPYVQTFHVPTLGPKGVETPINTTTTGAQQTTSQDGRTIAVNASGVYAVVWTAPDGNGLGIYARMYNANGTPRTGEFLVNNVTANDQITPAIAIDGAGNVVVTWASQAEDGSGYGIYARRFDATGGAYGAAFRVSETSVGDQVDPSIGMDAGGRFVISWTSSDNDGTGIYARRYSGNGVAASGEFLVNTDYTTGSQTASSVALTASGEFVVVWQGAGPTDFFDIGDADGIYGRRYAANGAAADETFRVNSGTLGLQSSATVAMNAQGDFVVAWVSGDGDGTGVYAQLYRANEAKATGELLVNTTTVGTQDAPSVSMDATGDFVVVWNGTDASGTGVYSRIYDAGGRAGTPETLVNTTTAGDQHFASVAMLPNGDYIVAWTDSGLDGDGAGIFLQRVTENFTPTNIVVTPSTVNEGLPPGTVIGTFATTDPDGVDTFTYAIASDPTNSFAVVGNTLVTTVALDFDAGVTRNVSVEVTDSVGNKFVKQLTITIANVAPATPTDADSNGDVGPQSGLITEGSVAGRVVGITAQAIDPAGGVITYSLVDSADGRFTIDSATGVVTTTNANVDFESAAGNIYTITVRATDAGGLSSQQSFIIGVINAAPVLATDLDAAANTLQENVYATPVTVGITANATDPAGGAITYSLADDAGGLFTIDSVTGVVSTAAGAVLNFETAGNAYNIVVRASDPLGLSSDTTFTINITNVLPTAPVDVNGAANTVDDGATGGTVVGITALSTDQAGGTLTYSLATNPNGMFAIDATTGVVTVAAGKTINFETATSYGIVVQVSDGGTPQTSPFTITVNNLPPTAPVDANGAVNSVVEGAKSGTVVGVTASSADPGGGTVTYSLTDNAGGRFVINATTGVVTVASGAVIDRETSGGSYTIVVSARDASFAATTQAFVINVTNVAPTAPKDVNSGKNQVAEGAAAGTLVGVTAQSTDAAGGNLTYALTNDAGGRFVINSATGVITVAAGANLNSQLNKSWVVSVTATDGVATTAAVNFTIAVVNVAPVISGDSDATANTVLEGAAAGTTVGVTAAATDFGATVITYSLSSNPNKWFAINSTTGVVTVAPNAKINFGSKNDYTITVRASDGTSYSSQNFVISVLNVAPSAPIDANAALNTLTEGAKAGTKVGVTASSIDPSGGTIRYTLLVNPGNKFAIDSKGVITLAKGATVNFEDASSYIVTVQASDGLLTSTGNFTINIADLAPSLPTDSNTAVNFVSESAVAGDLVGITAAATDVAGGTLTYSLTNDADGRFVINSSTGVVSVASGAVIDFENDGGYYTITVQASDGTLSSSSDFTIGISHPNATAFVATDPVNSGLDSLFVYGTDGKDSIKVALVAGQYQVTINKVVVGTFPPPTGGLYVYGAMGDDTIDVGSTTTLNAFIDGGLGNDKISGGLGNDVILGRDGKDSLAGRGGKDVIIGGLGADSITADGTGATSLNEGNILIGDSTDYDADLAALAAISAAWIGNNTATVDTYLSSATVHGDGLTDTVKHTKLGIDWFYAFELNSKGGRLDKLSVGTGDIVK